MEFGGNEQKPIAKVDKPILASLRKFRDRLRLKEVLPLSWEDWKRVIIENRRNGVPEETAPQRFSVSTSLLNTFQEMMPVEYPGKIDDKLFPEAASIAKKKLEVARAMVVDESGNRLLVHTQNGGESKLIAGDSMVIRSRVKGQLGGLHTHPNNGMPSSDDVIMLLRNDNIAEFVITPYRVIVLLRTNQTPTFSNRSVAKGYLEGLNMSKGETEGKDAWKLDYKDFHELHILAYEAERGRDVFVRKDNKK